MNFLSYSKTLKLTVLRRNGEQYYSHKSPQLTPRSTGEDGAVQGALQYILYRPSQPEDKSVLELWDDHYTWRMTARQVDEVEAFIAAFDPETDAVHEPGMSLEERLSLAREERESRLRATDFLMLPDYPLDAGARQEIAAYRQALRDLPETCDAWPDIEDWPNVPGWDLADHV